jgi:hypothetical protein
VPEWFWLADPIERIAHDGFNQVQHSERDSALSLYPLAQIVAKLVLEHRDATLLWSSLT